MALRLKGAQFRQQAVEIERSGEHGYSSVGRTRPQFVGTIPIQFDAILIWITQVKSLANPVIGRPIEHNTRFNQACECIG